MRGIHYVDDDRKENTASVMEFTFRRGDAV
jgi:hypothetical protein